MQFKIPLPLFAAIRTLLTIKMKKPIQEVTPNSSIRQLSGGKSALQNEVLGDLAKLGGDIDQGAEMELEALAKTAGARYNKMGLPSLVV